MHLDGRTMQSFQKHKILGPVLQPFYGVYYAQV